MLVSDLKRVNPKLVRAGNPLDGSSHILKRLEPDENLFGSIDLSSGYHQVTIHPDSKDLFTIILLTGRYRYMILPQGASISSDYFNLSTDEGVTNQPGFYKNIYDVLVTSPSLQKLEERMRKLLLVYRKRNMKLNPEKLQLCPEVTYGTKIEAARQEGDKKITVYMAGTHQDVHPY